MGWLNSLQLIRLICRHKLILKTWQIVINILENLYKYFIIKFEIQFKTNFYALFKIFKFWILFNYKILISFIENIFYYNKNKN